MLIGKNTVGRKSELFLVVCAALVLLIATGCDDKRRHLAGAGVEFSSVEPPVSADAPPEAVAMATLDAIREAQLSRATGLGLTENRDRYERAIEILRTLSAADEIYQSVRTSGSPSIPKDITQDAALTLIAENWVSMVAHYVDGYQLNTLVNAVMVPNQQVEIYINAENSRDQVIVHGLRNPESGATSAPAETLVRADALAQGICPPIGVAILVRLTNLNGGWRVQRVSLGPARTTRTAAPLGGASNTPLEQPHRN